MSLQGGVRGSRNDPHMELTPVRQQESEILLARDLGQLTHHQNELWILRVADLPPPLFELRPQRGKQLCRCSAISWVGYRPLMRKRPKLPKQRISRRQGVELQ